MSLTKYSNQIAVDTGLNVGVTPTPIAAGDSVTVALSKTQAQLFELGAGTYIGSWDAATNTPTLSNATVEAAGNWYNVIVPGAVDFGAGLITFTTNDAVYSTGTVYAKRDLPNSAIALADGKILIGQVDGIAAQKTVSGQVSLADTGVMTINFDTRLTAGTFDGALKGGGVQYFNTDINVAIGSMVIGTPYKMYNSDTASHTLTITGAGAAVINGDALTVGLVQTVNPGTSYTLTLENATTVSID